MQLVCNECQRSFEMDIQEKQAEDGLTVVGFECPDCHTWFHGYFVDNHMEKLRVLLEKFRAKADRSRADSERYQRKRKAYQEAFYRLNQGRTGLAMPE